MFQCVRADGPKDKKAVYNSTYSIILGEGFRDDQNIIYMSYIIYHIYHIHGQFWKMTTVSFSAVITIHETHINT